jgi:redox-sensitive bicupin YhaK (pirin superfamily)
MGPLSLAAGEGLDVPPHPHIGLATVTYLFDGILLHRDSLGSVQEIRPGEINWMTAGRGIVHSERTPEEQRKLGANAHGLQLWVALPGTYEEVPPEFHHYPKDALPEMNTPGARIRVLAGKTYGVESPVRTLSPLFYVEAALEAGAELLVPNAYEERAAYIVEGVVCCGVERAEPGRMLVFTPHADVALRAESDSRLVLLGGAPIDGARHIWWNFVSSSEERIEQAKRDWQTGLFGKVPGDETESMPMPESPART